MALTGTVTGKNQAELALRARELAKEYYGHDNFTIELNDEESSLGV